MGELPEGCVMFTFINLADAYIQRDFIFPFFSIKYILDPVLAGK